MAIHLAASAQPSGPLPEALAPASVESSHSLTNGLGSWIWANRTYDRQTCQFWRAFDIPETASVTRARLLMTADNEFTLFLNGRQLGRGAEWRNLCEFDLTQLLSSGRHVLAVQAFNSATSAGMIFSLRVDLSDGQVIEVKSDSSWRMVPEGGGRWKTREKASDSWPAATIVGNLGEWPWWKTPQNIEKIPPLLPVQTLFWQSGWFQITLLSVCGLVILISFRLMAQLALRQKEHWLLQRERARIARDIHDDLGSRMTQLVLYGEVAQSELPTDSKTRGQLDLMCQEAREVLYAMDEILWAVNPRRDTLHDFASYVCSYAQEFLKPTAIQCFFEVDQEMSTAAFDLPLRRSLLMAIKETLHNAVKHSQATELHLQIRWHHQKLLVVVQDNGRGFKVGPSQPGSHGLTNMNQRLSELGGRCLVTSQPDQGCRVEFVIPLAHDRTQALWGWVWKLNPFSKPLHETRHLTVNKSSPLHDPSQC